MPKKRIVYLHRYAPELEARNYTAMEKLIQRLSVSYQTIYLCSKSPMEPDPILRSTMEVKTVPFSINQYNKQDKWAKTLLYYLYLPRLLCRLRKLEPHCIICKETLPFIPMLVSRLNIPMVITTSDWWLSTLFGGTAFSRKLADKLESWEVKHWNRPHVHVIASSQAEADLVIHRGVNSSRVTIINQPLPPDLFYPCKAPGALEKFGITKANWTLATHGLIRPGKGYRQILAWWKDIAIKHPDWRFLIIGGGEGAKWCEREIQHQGLQKQVIMSGWLPTQEDVNRCLNASDCLLVCRRNTIDNQGVMTSALYHSLATGRPTVATGLPGFSEVIRDRKDGFLFIPDSYKSFMETLEYVHDHPDEAQQIGKAGEQRGAHCFDPQRTISMFGHVIDNITAE